jgi:hypothetical protein
MKEFLLELFLLTIFLGFFILMFVGLSVYWDILK